MEQNRSIVNIIIPTYNNNNQLSQCVNSMLNTYTIWPFKIIIVNNGDKNSSLKVPDRFIDKIKLVEPDGNLGWTGGIKEGLKHCDGDIVLFANDDIFIPPSSANWLHSMVRILQNNRNLAAVGPSTNCAMGLQNIWSDTTSMRQYSSFLIGFCMLVDRNKLDEVGGIDLNFPTGDDIDLSIRFRNNGYLLCVDKSTFVYHHGFQTGNRIHGDHTVANGWNSPQMTKKTDMMLIKKHGFLKWWHTMVKPSDEELEETEKKALTNVDSEGDVVRSYVNGDSPDSILEIGCGPQLTIEGSIGLDMIENGSCNPHVPGESKASITHDFNIDDKMPISDNKYSTIIARHIIEHCIDPIKTLRDIHRILIHKGKLIVSLPDERIGSTIVMNPEHLHAYTPNSFVSMAEMTGFEVKNISEGYNGVSFTVLMEKE